ncbi:hypothetical protein [Pseudooceanicola algae]|nr:hypothetical protein [Pseudooceanicola algae]
MSLSGHVLLTAALFATALPLRPAQADEITDTLESAREAYEQGDLSYALDELDFARQKMLAMRTDVLLDLLPPAPDGWERQVNDEMGAGMAMMGGGLGAEADYIGPEESVTVTIMAQNPLIASISAMVSNAAAFGARIERVGREKFMLQDDVLQGMVGGNVLVKAEGGTPGQMIALLESMDFRALQDFGR